MFGRSKVHIYLKSGAVVKMRMKSFSMSTNKRTNERTASEWSWRWWHNRRLFDVRVEDISAIVVSRW